MKFTKEQVQLLIDGAIAVIPTDTIYGFSASVFKPDAIERIKAIKSRQYTKPFIILIGEISELRDLGVDYQPYIKYIDQLWPGPNTLIFPFQSNQLGYLNPAGNTLAIRLPNHPELRQLLLETGPLVSTSINLDKGSPINDPVLINQLFSNQIDMMLSVGKLIANPSSIYQVDLQSDRLIKLR
ncbi:Sua5/YciO/YrdC/YwlC family protein [Candidatus Saccharibacteria bacterium]|nr:Sua5/YciO/YrdC/YwlC family protein [Candidatus Saccharibacteria bacterium]